MHGSRPFFANNTLTSWRNPMTIKQILGALALATIMSTAAHAADAPAAPAAPEALPVATAPAPATAPTAADAAPAVTEKCEVTKDGKTTTSDVAVGTCEKEGGKVVKADEKKAEEKKPEGDAMKPAEKK